MWGNRSRVMRSDSDLSAGLFSKIKRRFRFGSKGRYDINSDATQRVEHDGITVLRRESIECISSPKTNMVMDSADERKTMSLPRIPAAGTIAKCNNLNVETVDKTAQPSPKRTSVIATEEVANNFLISDERAVDLDHEHAILPDEYDDVFDPGYETLDEIRKKVKMCSMTNKSSVPSSINVSGNSIQEVTSTEVLPSKMQIKDTVKSEIGIASCEHSETRQSNRDSGLGSPNLESNSPESKRSVRTSSLDSCMVSDVETVPDELPAPRSLENETTLTDENSILAQSSADVKSYGPLQEELYANSALKIQRKSMSTSTDNGVQKRTLNESLSDAVSREVVVKDNSLIDHLSLSENEPPQLPARNYTLENELSEDNYIDDEPIHMSLTELLQSKSRRQTSAQLDSAMSSVCESNLSMPSPALPPRKPIIMSDFLETMRQLKSCSWYWGPLSCEEARAILDNKADGSFLVRDSSNDRYILTISFKSQGMICHTRIEHNKGMFSFWSQPDSHGKRGIVTFIEQAMYNSRNHQFLYFLRPTGPGLPPTPLYLLYPISRFNHIQSLQHLCRFIILCFVRRDHIDALPIPGRIKDYLKERQCYIEYWEDEVACRNCSEAVAPEST